VQRPAIVSIPAVSRLYLKMASRKSPVASVKIKWNGDAAVAFHGFNRVDEKAGDF